MTVSCRRSKAGEMICRVIWLASCVCHWLTSVSVGDKRSREHLFVLCKHRKCGFNWIQSQLSKINKQINNWLSITYHKDYKQTDHITDGGNRHSDHRAGVATEAATRPQFLSRAAVAARSLSLLSLFNSQADGMYIYIYEYILFYIHARKSNGQALARWDRLSLGCSQLTECRLSCRPKPS